MLPGMQVNSERMVSIFMAIEQLEHIVSEARLHVNAVEAEVAAAEREKSMLTSVFRSVKSSLFSVSKCPAKNKRKQALGPCKGGELSKRQ